MNVVWLLRREPSEVSHEARDIRPLDQLIVGERSCHTLARTPACVREAWTRCGVLRARRSVLRGSPRSARARAWTAATIRKLGRCTSRRRARARRCGRGYGDLLLPGRHRGE